MSKWPMRGHFGHLGYRCPNGPCEAILSIYATDVQMAHARPFWASTLQDLSIDIKNALRQGNLTPKIVF